MFYENVHRVNEIGPLRLARNGAHGPHACGIVTRTGRETFG